MVCAAFNGNPYATIVSYHSFDHVYVERDMSTFYNELAAPVWHIPKQNVVIIAGDMNAHTGKYLNYKLCFHNQKW